MSDVFRQVYTKLDEEQIKQVRNVKEKAQELWDAIDNCIEDGERSERARLINVGKTELEKTVAIAVKGITTEKE